MMMMMEMINVSFMMSFKDLCLILMGLKWITMRKETDKHKIGGIYQIKLNLFDEYSFKVRVTDKILVNLNEMDDGDFYGVGYNKADYLSHSYNIKNPSHMRYLYKFEIVEVNYNRLKEIGVI